MTLTLVQNGGTVPECRFEAATAAELVPGLLWSADRGMKPSPAALMGHGRTSHERSPYVLALARRLAARGWNAVAIDAQGHGERRGPGTGPPTAFAEFRARYLGELSP